MSLSVTFCVKLWRRLKALCLRIRRRASTDTSHLAPTLLTCAEAVPQEKQSSRRRDEKKAGQKACRRQFVNEFRMYVCVCCFRWMCDVDSRRCLHSPVSERVSQKSLCCPSRSRRRKVFLFGVRWFWFVFHRHQDHSSFHAVCHVRTNVLSHSNIVLIVLVSYTH